MAKPTDVTEVGLELYGDVQPLTYGDTDATGWPLLRYCDALVQGAQQAATYGRDNGDEPGWAIAANPTTAPAEALDWLSQFAGVNLETLRKTLQVRQQNMMFVPNFTRTTLGNAPFKWANGGKAATTFKVTEGWEAGRKTLEIVTASMASTEQNVAQGKGGTTLGGKLSYILVKEGEHYSLRAAINVTSITGSMRFKMMVEWYDLNGNLLSTSELGTNFTTTGVKEFTGSLDAPAKAVGAWVCIVSEATAAASKATLFVDKVAMASSPQNEVLAYGDGDTVGWLWVGTAGESESQLRTLQTEEEYIAARRARIIELPARKRGTLESIIKAAQQYLIGNKTVYVVERDGGPYRLTVVTFQAETPSASQTKAAIEEQVPGGIILNYQALPTTSWGEILGEYASWKAVSEAFVTWGGVRVDKPGS